MKNFRKIIYSAAGLLMFISSCKLDNYPAPHAGIQGEILDAATGKKVPTEQPSGIDMRLLETKYGANTTPTDFWVKPDGSFEDDAIFAGQYKVVPIQGAFFDADTALVTVSGLTTVNFKVVPFLNINATITPGTGSVTVSYTLSREQVGDKIMVAKTLVSAFPSVSNTINEFSQSHDLSGTDDATVLATTYTDTITGLTSGSTYYVRVGAETNNTYSKYNYSEVVAVKIP